MELKGRCNKVESRQHEADSHDKIYYEQQV